jgi:hypothetical protein
MERGRYVDQTEKEGENQSVQYSNLRSKTPTNTGRLYIIEMTHHRVPDNLKNWSLQLEKPWNLWKRRIRTTPSPLPLLLFLPLNSQELSNFEPSLINWKSR